MGMLYVVPTPVGNLEDITMRALRVLREADFILAEDTRTTSKLLKHFEIQVPAYSHHKFNEHKTVGGLVERIQNSEHHVALVSDALEVISSMLAEIWEMLSTSVLLASERWPIF